MMTRDEIETKWKTLRERYHLVNEYVRKRDEKRGILVAYKDDNSNVCIGYSLCCNLDMFDKFDGFEVAIGRANKMSNKKQLVPTSLSCEERDVAGGKDVFYIPESIADQFYEFVRRCKKYYKDSNSVLPEWTSCISEELVAE